MSAPPSPQQQAIKAVRTLFRTFVRLTHDVERVATKSDSKSKALAPLLAHYANGCGVGKQFMTLQDLRSHIRESFRTQNPKKNMKEKLSDGIQGIRQLQQLLTDLETGKTISKAQEPTTSPAGQVSAVVDDSWVAPYLNQVHWLAPLDDEYSHGQSEADATGQPQPQQQQQFVEMPLFPLTGPFFTPNQTLELFTAYSYWEFPTPGAEILLKIFEPRYRALYNDLIAQPSTSHRRFVVPFSHPHEPTVFADYGLVYQITDWKEVADETNGVFQFVCQHVVTHPVKIRKILNPQAHHSQETYLRAQTTIEMDAVELDVAARRQLERALDDHVVESMAKKCKHALRVEGTWGFIRCWNTLLQQRLLQVELQVAAQVKFEIQQTPRGKEATADDVQKIIRKIQNQRRAELLGLKLDLSLSIPRVLQTQNSEDRLRVLLDLIASFGRHTNSSPSSSWSSASPPF